MIAKPKLLPFLQSKTGFQLDVNKLMSFNIWASSHVDAAACVNGGSGLAYLYLCICMCVYLCICSFVFVYLYLCICICICECRMHYACVNGGVALRILPSSDVGWDASTSCQCPFKDATYCSDICRLGCIARGVVTNGAMIRAEGWTETETGGGDIKWQKEMRDKTGSKTSVSLQMVPVGHKIFPVSPQ